MSRCLAGLKFGCLSVRFVFFVQHSHEDVSGAKANGGNSLTLSH